MLSRSREREPARGHHVAHERELVGHHAVEAELEHLVHRRLVVDRPDMHGQAGSMRGLDEPGGDDRERIAAEFG
jgi:hypothetical protein